MAEKRDIRMIALDLDRTTIREDDSLPDRTADALNRAGAEGVDIVIATGRVLGALPDSLSALHYIKYCICSNGAAVYRPKRACSLKFAEDAELIYQNCLDPAAVEIMTEYVRKAGYMFESFTGGCAYIGKDYYDMVDKGVLEFRRRDYVVNTRKPVEDIFGFTLDHKERIENLNVFFPSQAEKEKFRPFLEAIPDATLTSSLPTNYELGGNGVSKGDALRFLMNLEGIESENLMAAGDSPNDITMLELAGLPVAVENAEPSVKRICTYTAPPCEAAGVGEAVERFVL